MLLVASFAEARTVLISKRINYLEEIHFQGAGKIVLKQGEHPDLQIEGDEAIIHDTKVEVERGELHITRKESAFKRASPTLVCTVTVADDLSRITLKGDAELVSEPIKFYDVEINVHDRVRAEIALTSHDMVGQIFDLAQLKTSGRVDSQEILIEDSGQYLGGALESTSCEVKIVGDGRAVVQADDSLSAFVVGSGTIHYTKTPKELTQRVSGTGKIFGP